jgi:GNAT superfamily N-acetyltransferase
VAILPARIISGMPRGEAESRCWTVIIFASDWQEIEQHADTSFAHRLACFDDMQALTGLMQASMRALLPQFLTPAEVQASFAVMGLDSQLIEDGTYFAVEAGGILAGCGGWSRRATLFGGNHSAGRDARLLDPFREAARVRAMYTDPGFVRRGIGRKILALCEDAARGEGFARAELGATMAGKPLYEAAGYQPIGMMMVPTPTGVAVPILRMGKTL